MPADVSPILSLDQAAEVVKLRPQTLKRKVAIAPQSLYEMCVVLTRPAVANGGFGMTAAQAGAEIAATRALIELLPETTSLLPLSAVEWALSADH